MWFKDSQENNNPQEDEKTPLRLILDYVELILVALAIVIPIRYFIVQPFSVRGMSMEPNFYEKEYLVVDEISYRFREPQRGEVVVVRHPKETGTYLLKRIIGLPKETVKLQGTKVLISADKDGEVVLDESQYIRDKFIIDNNQPLNLNNDEFFVMGDNRDNSLDSRSFGPVNRNYIIGRVWIRAWPFEKFTVMKGR